jgi:predicted permease
VRLLLIDTPELDQGPFGEVAKVALEGLLPVGEQVELETDVDTHDQYDRLLAYLYLSDGRMVNEVLLEMGVAVAGGVAGVLLTFWSRHVLTNLLTAGLGTAPLMTRMPLEVAVDLPLIAATFGLCVVVAVFFSLLPALRLTRGDSTSGLRTAVVGESSPKLRLGRGLVALQIGISVPLLVCAVLFLRTLANLGGVNLGFDPAGLVYFKVNPDATSQSASGHASLYLQAIEQVRHVPGVTAVTLVENALLSGIVSNTQVTIDGEKRSWHMNAIGPGYLETMGVRLLAGRVPGAQDGPGAPAVAAINETAARQAFGSESPLGRSMVVSSRSVEIVGVVSDTHYDSPRSEVPPTFFDSALQRAGYRGHHIVARTSLPVAQLEPALKDAMAAVDRELPAPEITSQITRLQQTTNRERVFAQLLTLFGVFALLLASIGLHGVTSYSVERRAKEIGVRMALGAAPGQVLWMVQRQVVVLVVIGLAIGLPAALWTTPLLGALLFGVAPTDPGVLATGAVVMLLVAMAAGWLPARRAATSDPLRALRKE